MLKFKDFPKLECPFVRKMINNRYLITDELNPEFKWFLDDDVIATEKIHGTCCAIIIENGVVVSMFNRTNRINFIGGTLSKALTEGVNNALAKGRFVLQDGIYWGELIGEKIQKNEYKLEGHEWLPFDWVRSHCYYKSWGKYPKDFQTISNWLKDDLLPLFALKKGNKQGFVEGIVFFKKSTGQMCKIRRDMFDWFYKSGDKKC